MSAESQASSSTSTSPSNSTLNWYHEVAHLKNDGSNFQTWKFWVKMVLELRGLFNVIKGELKKPDDMKLAQYLSWAQSDME
ncbi:hypothetical protein AX17_006908, partial [Amanita inopinata Kibby_2008]